MTTSAKLARLLAGLPKDVRKDILSANLIVGEYPDALHRAYLNKRFSEVAHEAPIEKMRCELKEKKHAKANSHSATR